MGVLKFSDNLHQDMVVYSLVNTKPSILLPWEPKNISTFRTSLVWMHPTPISTTPTIIQIQGQSIDLTQVKFYYQNNRLLLAGLFVVLLLTPLAIICWLLKKLCRRIIDRPRRDKLNQTGSESALSGECGCIIRIRKNKKTTDWQETSRGNSHPVRSTHCTLIKFKNMEPQTMSSNKNSNNSNNRSRMDLCETFSLDDDLDEYSEFTKGSLNCLRNDLDQLQKF